MRAPTSRTRLLFAVTGLGLVLPLLAQQGVVSFKHFHRYPATGQWTTEGYTTIGGKPMGAPVTSTACASPISAARLAAIRKMGNDAAPQCTNTVLRDEERTAESEQVCTFPKQTFHTTLHAVDDQTMAEELSYPAPDGSRIVVHTTSHFLGACTAAQTAEADAASKAPLPSMQPSAEACAELASGHQSAMDAVKSCESADYPEDRRADCRTQMQGLLARLTQIERSCKK